MHGAMLFETMLTYGKRPDPSGRMGRLCLPR